ncbi:MAG: DUF4352 domain-containing protein [Halobacteriota archaeon]
MPFLWGNSTLSKKEWYKKARCSKSSGGGSGNAGIAVKVNSQQTASQIGTYSTPAAGNEFIIFNVTVTNLNQDNELLGNPNFFKLTTADGAVYQYSSSTFSAPNALQGVQNTNAGDKVSGVVAFEVPQGAIAKTLTYNDDINVVVTNL